jgi:hypothetical protein
MGLHLCVLCGRPAPTLASLSPQTRRPPPPRPPPGTPFPHVNCARELPRPRHRPRQAWSSLGAPARTAAVAYAHSKGAVVMLSAGGSTESPYTGDAKAYGTAAATEAVNLDLDGVDFDLENLSQVRTRVALCERARVPAQL